MEFNFDFLEGGRMSLGSFDPRLVLSGLPSPRAGGGQYCRDSPTSEGSCEMAGACLERSLEGNTADACLSLSESTVPPGGESPVYSTCSSSEQSGSEESGAEVDLPASPPVQDQDFPVLFGSTPEASSAGVPPFPGRLTPISPPESGARSYIARSSPISPAGVRYRPYLGRYSPPVESPSSAPCSPLFSGMSSRKTEGEVCFGCGNSITERYLLKVSGRAWHVTCLRCSVCQSNLDCQSSCYIKDENIYCKLDYSRQFGTKCSKCLRHIQSTDWVRRAKTNVYHLACFSCDSCKRQLSTGEEFALQDSRVLCKTHYVELIEGGSNTDEFGEFSADESGSQKQKTKRVRTTFTEEQLQVLQANFQLDSNPDGQDLERIAQITGLSKRVTQVWFQNSRARQKKHQQTAQNRMNSLNNLSTSLGGATISITTTMSTPSPSDSMYHQALTLSPLKSVYIDTS